MISKSEILTRAQIIPLVITSHYVDTNHLVDSIVNEVEHEFQRINIKSDNSRRTEVNVCRQTMMMLMIGYTGMTLAEIGEYFQRDHSTVVHAKRAVSDRVETDPSYRLKLLKIICVLNAVHRKTVTLESLFAKSSSLAEVSYAGIMLEKKYMELKELNKQLLGSQGTISPELLHSMRHMIEEIETLIQTIKTKKQ